MDLQGACELIIEVEQKADVNSMRYEDEYLWPLVRQFLWVGCIQGKFECRTTLKETDGEKILIKKPTFLDHIHHIITRNNMNKRVNRLIASIRQNYGFSTQKIDICFLSQPIYYSELYKDRPYSRIIDPVFELLSTEYNCLKLEETFKGNVPPQRAYSCQFFNVLPLKVGVDVKVQRVVRKFSAILQEISTIAGVEKTELMQGLSVGLQQTLRYRDTYLTLLKKLQPKLFFITCYYFPAVMGLNWAANMRNIPTIDLQHGKQGKFQGMYSHWTKIPEEGYAMLPTWFWSWGKPSVENIMKWQEGRKTHRSLIGGYPWISRWNESEFMNMRLELPDAEKIILITTQAPVGGLDDFFPDMLVDAIKQSPKEWCWIIREHPNYQEGNSIIRDKLKEIGENRFIMDIYNKVPLYSLLSKCDFHITAYSSVCYEADAFSVPTAIFSEVGREMYEQEIKADRFVYCDDGESLVHAITYFKAEKNKVEYIGSDVRLIFSALQTVGKGSGLNVANIEDTM